jgi:SAM-dependent methyltransferase
MSNIPNKIDASYYDQKYYADLTGKPYTNIQGNTSHWGYLNPTGEWVGCGNIAVAWKTIFKLNKCNTDTGLCKALDVGCGRGTFTAYCRDVGIECWGFDYSKWAIEHPYPRCQKGWCVEWDATKAWPYGDKSFDLVLALDIMEHIYTDDLDFVVNEMYRVAKKWVFLQIATSGDGSGYILRKGENVPVQLEVNVVAGHVTVQNREFWVNTLLKDSNGVERGWKLRDDKVLEFIGKVPADVISNWLKNTMICMEKV